MYAHERSLVKRLANKPFVLLGVNSDQDLRTLKPILQKEHITWRSWQNQKGSKGPISQLYQVRGWPTVYILDAQGIIRHKFIGPANLNKPVDALLREMGELALGGRVHSDPRQ